MELHQIIHRVERILDDHKSNAASWGGQPAEHVRSKINTNFDEAKREIVNLLRRELSDLGK